MLKLGAQVCVRTLLSNFVKSRVVESVKKENLLLLNAQFVRNTSFFNKYSKQQLWKGVLSVSNAGKRKGRGRNRERPKSIIPERPIGEGDIRISWPGLNTHILSGNNVSDIEVLPEVKKAVFIQPESKKKSRKVHPLDRGWSGRVLGGKKLGPPEPTEDMTFEGFESIILVHKSMSVMTSAFGRKRKFLTIVATGNGNGLLGLSLVKKFNQKSTIKLAQKKASKKLISIDLIEKHTVNHDFCSHYGRTRVLVFKKPKGYGLKCHRAITAICQLLGIENLSAKVEGSCNVPNLIRAFVVGLLRQKTYQQIADENKLHLVEFKKESENFPTILASPKQCLSISETRRKPVMFEEYIMGNKLLYRPNKKVPFYEKLPSWTNHLKKTLFRRNHDNVKIDLLVKYGTYRSHLTDIYPESVGLSCLQARKNNSESLKETESVN